MAVESSTLVILLGVLALGAILGLVSALSRKGRSEDEARAYLAGVHYMLSDDADAAIAELSRAAQLNRQTLETYFALGALFLRKGEHERAIRLHQNMLLRAGLSPDVRRRALTALALDYRRSGLTDKALETLQELLRETPGHPEGLRQYRQLLEDEAEWGSAVEVQRKLCKLEGRGEEVLAHLLAGAARGARAEPDRACALAQEAVAVAPHSADAHLALAEALVAAAPSESAAALKTAVELEPELAPRAIRLLGPALEATTDVQAFLKEQIAKRGEAGAPFELALAMFHRGRGGTRKAIDVLRPLVERRPQLWEARRELGELLLEQDRSEELRADYREILGRLGDPSLGFTCTSCRQRLPEHVFRCGSCGAWDSVRRDPDSPSAMHI